MAHLRMKVVAAFLFAAGLPALMTAARHTSPSSRDTRVPPSPVWIDTDPAVGLPDRDVDDGLALIQAFHSPELVVRGVSAVFGNAPLDRALPIAEGIVSRFGPRSLAVHRGAAGAADLGVDLPATRAMAAALARERLTVLALGPATNVATLLKRHPALAGQIAAVVAVAGRRPGHRFTTGSANRRGHRDFNFEQDPDAFRVILDSDVPLVLAPFELSSRVWLTERDLAALDGGGAAGRWLAAPARAWLRLWREVFEVEGFNPFDALAVASVTSPDWLRCSDLPVRIQVGPDDATEERMQGTLVVEKPYLEVSDAFVDVKRRARYCYAVDARFKDDLIRRLRAPGDRD